MTPNHAALTASTTQRRMRAMAKKAIVASLAVVTVFTGSISAAQAAPAYEISGSWSSGTPVTVSRGNTVVSEWHFNVNDGGEAPSNEEIANVTLDFEVSGGSFTALPAACLVDAVSPISEISADGKQLLCNLGSRPQGSAELMLTGIQVTGATGEALSVTGKIGDQSATTPALDISNIFAMDMKWDGGRPTSAANGTQQEISFPWSLRHAPGGTPGPSTVSYTMTVAVSNGENVGVAPTACTPISSPQPGHPFSGANGTAGQDRAAFPSCTMTRVGSTNTFTVTLSNIDYSKSSIPKYDGQGAPLPAEWDVVAAGRINFRFVYVQNTSGTFRLTANAPTYVSIDGERSTDSSSNNANTVTYTRGSYTGGWTLNSLADPVSGAQWTDTFRQLPGQPALAVAGVRSPTGTEGTTQACSVLDSKYVTFVSARVGSISKGVVTPYAGTQPSYEYYTGNDPSVNPAVSAYNPNLFNCNLSTGWTTSLPSDLSTVKAVRVTIPATLQVTDSVATMRVMSTIKADVAIGQDIWTWTSYRFGSGGWETPDRATTGSPPGAGVATPNSRYPYAAAGRDVLRVTGARPVLHKTASSKETAPGATVSYTLQYEATAPSTGTLNNFKLVDLLPAGASYLPGSATIAPSSISTVGGRTQLTWDFTNTVRTNTDYFLHYEVVLPSSAQPKDVFTNTATASTGGMSAQATATVTIADGGYVFVTMSALQDSVAHRDGAASSGWTVRLTSRDTSKQAWTDTIDVLPYNGDGRGTTFAGTVALSGPVDAGQMPGATVYYTTAPQASLSDNPKHASNGTSAGSVTGNTVGWSTQYSPNATAVRVIGGALAHGVTQSFTVNVVTTGAEFQDRYVNRAVAVASRTNLVMRTSALFEIAAEKSVAIKKLVQGTDGTWHDAQNIDDYAGHVSAGAVNYRLVVTNTGDVALTNLVVEDNRVDLAALSPLPAPLGAGATIAELAPGDASAVTIDYQAVLPTMSIGETLLNTACVNAEDPTVEEACDSAGVIAIASSLSWTKVSAGSGNVRIEGAKWTLTQVDTAGNEVGSAREIVDCVAAAAENCTAEDRDHRPGEFQVQGLEAGRYKLIETAAPAGYKLDSTPRFIDVSGASSIALPIENEQRDGLVIPFTGGESSASFILLAGALGGLLLLAGGIKLRRRRGETH